MGLTDKASFRQHCLRLRQQLPVASRRQASQVITQKLIHHPRLQAAKSVCSYISYSGEVDTHSFIEWCFQEGKTVSAPRVSGQHLVLHQINSLKECLPAFKGILEPPSSAPIVDSQTVDAYIILGLAFDAFKFRLGYGKGYTDKLFTQLDTYFAIGLCFTDQLVYSLPHENHDFPVSEVITDTVSLF